MSYNTFCSEYIKSVWILKCFPFYHFSVQYHITDSKLNSNLLIPSTITVRQQEMPSMKVKTLNPGGTDRLTVSIGTKSKSSKQAPIKCKWSIKKAITLPWQRLFTEEKHLRQLSIIPGEDVPVGSHQCQTATISETANPPKSSFCTFPCSICRCQLVCSSLRFMMVHLHAVSALCLNFFFFFANISWANTDLVFCCRATVSGGYGVMLEQMMWHIVSLLVLCCNLHLRSLKIPWEQQDLLGSNQCDFWRLIHSGYLL